MINKSLINTLATLVKVILTSSLLIFPILLQEECFAQLVALKSEFMPGSSIYEFI